MLLLLLVICRKEQAVEDVGDCCLCKHEQILFIRKVMKVMAFSEDVFCLLLGGLVPVERDVVGSVVSGADTE